MTRRKDPNAPPPEHTLWPKRKIVEVKTEVIGQDPRTGRDVSLTYDVLECGHKKKRGTWRQMSSTVETPNVNRHCQACYDQGAS